MKETQGGRYCVRVVGVLAANSCAAATCAQVDVAMPAGSNVQVGDHPILSMAKDPLDCPAGVGLTISEPWVSAANQVSFLVYNTAAVLTYPVANRAYAIVVLPQGA